MVWCLPWVVAWLLLAGCARQPGPARAAESSGFQVPATLDEALGRMDALLDTARAAGVEAGGAERLYRAEELSDRLVETETTHAWLAGEDYSVDARLRQIQAIADRVIARVRGGARREELEADVVVLQSRVRDLRDALGRGGRPAPVPLAELLAILDTARR